MSSDKELKQLKLIIKSWEYDFKTREKRNPTKEDIKVGPSHIREAWKLYYSMKTSILQETILAAEDDEEPAAETPNPIEPTPEPIALETPIPADTINKESVWGDHLKRTLLQSKENTPKLTKSTSFQFTEKLFKGSNIKKRNPRKFSLVNRSKSETTLVTSNDDSQPSCASEICSDVDKVVQNADTDFGTDADTLEDTDTMFNLSNKIQVTQGGLFNNFQPISIQQPEKCKIFIGKLNSGWLERCNQVCNLDTTSEVVEASDDEEDFVYGSDDESSRFSVFATPPTVTVTSEGTKSIRNVEQCAPVAEPVALLETETTTAEIATSASSERAEPEPVAVTEMKTTADAAKPTSLKRAASSSASSAVPSKRLKFLNEETKSSKLAALEAKVASGKVNENFVGINLKKKIYARGKKRFSVGKHKKEQWKMKKRLNAAMSANNAASDRIGVSKCFKCGDVGHYARNCKNNATLVPQEYVEDEEDCVFPTLEEAAEMVNSNQPLANVNLAEPLEDDLERVPPLYEGDSDGGVVETPPEVFSALAEFGYKNFRPKQEKAIMRILSGKSTLVISSTGSGKSLCYQLPAYLYAKKHRCISLVVSPLVSLMEDQMINFPKILNAACLHTNQSDEKRKEIFEQIRQSQISVLLVSPEAMVSTNSPFNKALLKDLPPIAFVCIDEVHCVSQWSHNFRTSYLMICKILKERFNVRTFLGLTATASKSTLACIRLHLGIEDGENGVLTDCIIPPNLTLSISRDKRKDEALTVLLTSEPFSEYKSIIIYCIRRNECERVASFLRTFLQDARSSFGDGRTRKLLSEDVEAYHAGMTAPKRKRVQTAFISGKLRIVVATVAFGMGINKANIRGIIHYNMPSTYEHYVQEIGRAGRDGLPARCHLFLDCEGHDLPELRRHIYANSVDRYVIRKLLEKVFITCDCKKAEKDACKKHEVAFSVEQTIKSLDLFQENITTLLCYLELLFNDMVQVLPCAYVTCAVQSYSGVRALTNAARECAPLAYAVAEMRKTKPAEILNMLQFSVVELADHIGWRSNTVKYQLKNCEWTKVNDKPKRTGVHVAFSDLGFHILSRGDLSESEMDEALNALYSMVQSQEKQALYQLETCYRTFTKFSFANVNECLASSEEVVDANSEDLKRLIKEYFTEESQIQVESQSENTLTNEDAVVCEIRRLLINYRDCSFTGRAIARILHGIESPNFPATVWARSPSWRYALKEDFNALCKVALKELRNII